MKKLINGILGIAGYQLVNKNYKGPRVNRPDSMTGALLRLKELGINPSRIIDVGAASGAWTRGALKIWPNANYELIEPLKEQEANLALLKSEYANVTAHEGVAGEMPGEVLFSVSEDLDGSGVYGNSDTKSNRSIPVITLDSITKNESGHFLIKLDTHGYELPILKGANNTLSKTDALIIEVYGFHVSPTALLFHQLSTYLETIGFRLYDVVDVMRRKKDNAFWQADAVYLRANHPVFTDNRYA